MSWKLTLTLLAFFIATANSIGQSLIVSYPADVDTAGMDIGALLSLEKSLTLTLTSSGGSSDTLVIEMGPEAGNYGLLMRKFPLNLTGAFDDGCSLESITGGLSVGLGNYTGLSSFHVKAYLASAGESTAVTVSSE